jgi:hypothetical protein
MICETFEKNAVKIEKLKFQILAPKTELLDKL